MMKYGGFDYQFILVTQQVGNQKCIKIFRSYQVEKYKGFSDRIYVYFQEENFKSPNMISLGVENMWKGPFYDFPFYSLYYYFSIAIILHQRLCYAPNIKSGRSSQIFHFIRFNNQTTCLSLNDRQLPRMVFIAGKQPLVDLTMPLITPK